MYKWYALILFYMQNAKAFNITNCYNGLEINMQLIKLVAQLMYSVFLCKKGWHLKSSLSDF